MKSIYNTTVFKLNAGTYLMGDTYDFFNDENIDFQNGFFENAGPDYKYSDLFHTKDGHPYLSYHHYGSNFFALILLAHADNKKGGSVAHFENDFEVFQGYDETGKFISINNKKLRLPSDEHNAN